MVRAALGSIVLGGIVLGSIVLPVSLIWPVIALAQERVHAIAMHGAPKLGPGFQHFTYVNPDAPKGGKLVLGAVGTFDSLNPFIVKGVTPASIRGYVFESLLARSADEPFTLYGLLAQSVEMPDDRSSITFHLNPKARFSDGTPVAAEDVIFSFEILRSKGRPYMRSHYGKVSEAKVISERAVRFSFNAADDREIPLIMGLMPILPKHAVNAETFDQTTLVAPIGSGPYKLTQVDPGHSVTYTRDQDYWAQDLPVRRGHHNFDTVQFEYFRSSAAMFEAFKTGQIDYRTEGDPARWLDSYDFPAIKSGQIRKYSFETGLPAGMTGFVFNTRRAKFSDPNVRKALLYAFDAERINQQMFHGRYKRATSFFSRSSLASSGTPADALETALLKPFPGSVIPSVLDGTWRFPGASDNRGARNNLRKAVGLLKAAGYSLNGRQLVNTKSGQPFTIEFLVTTREQERIALAFGATLKKIGIATSIRQMEDSQYWARLGTFDFDMIQWTYRASLSPGNEQIHRWNSRYADIERSFNYPGVKSAAADAMIDAMLKAEGRAEFEAAVRAFDRVLISGHYVVPLFYDPKQWVAASSKLAFPKTTPLFGVDLNTWWIKQ